MAKRSLDEPSFTVKKKDRSLYIGIDTGLSGGIAWTGGVDGAMPMPVVEGKPRTLNLPAIKKTFETKLRAWKKVYVCIEKAQAMPKQGVVSMFNYGMGFGELKGLLTGLGIPFIETRPQAWKKDILAGTKRDKGAAIKYCQMKHPDIDLLPGQKRKPHDGMADAVCIADYCKKEFI